MRQILLYGHVSKLSYLVRVIDSQVVQPVGNFRRPKSCCFGKVVFAAKSFSQDS